MMKGEEVGRKLLQNNDMNAFFMSYIDILDKYAEIETDYHL